MNTSMEIEVFRAGDYGPKGVYSPDDVRQLAADYDPSWHEAPVTLDLRQEGPAYAWVEGLRCAGDVLVARLKDLHESLVEWVRQGAYKKRSIELYRSFARTGRPYLRALSFLGACPPEVKGLADPVFNEDEGERVVVEFDASPVGSEDDEATAFVEAAGDDSDAPEQVPEDAFAEVEALRGETERLSAELDKERTDRRRAELERFCEDGRRSGRILPAWEEAGLIEFMLGLDDGEPRIDAGDGRRLSPLAWFQDFLRAMRPQIELGEITPAPSIQGLEQQALPRPSERATIRPETLTLHERALAYCREHEGATYVEALQTVARL